MGDSELCGKALLLELQNTVATGAEGSVDTDRNRIVFDLGTLGFNEYMRIPLTYQWAVAQMRLFKFSNPIRVDVRSQLVSPAG